MGTFQDTNGEEYMIFEFCQKGSLLDFLRSSATFSLDQQIEMYKMLHEVDSLGWQEFALEWRFWNQ